MGLFDYRMDGQNPRLKKAGSIGIVSDRRVHPTKGAQVRVTDPATGKTSAWLVVEQDGTYGKQHFFCPRKGERIRVNRMANGLETGTVGKPFYCKAVKSVMPPHIDSDYVKYDDGSEIHYNPSKNAYTISLKGSGVFNITTAGGPVTITARSGQVNITANLINLNGVLIDSSGNVSIPGTLNVSGYTTLSGGGQAIPSITNSDGSGGGS